MASSAARTTAGSRSSRILRSLRLHDHDAERVRQHVVHVAGDPATFGLGRELPGQRPLLAEQRVRGGELGGQQSLPPHDGARHQCGDAERAEEGDVAGVLGRRDAAGSRGRRGEQADTQVAQHGGGVDEDQLGQHDGHQVHGGHRQRGKDDGGGSDQRRLDRPAPAGRDRGRAGARRRPRRRRGAAGAGRRGPRLRPTAPTDRQRSTWRPGRRPPATPSAATHVAE